MIIDNYLRMELIVAKNTESVPLDLCNAQKYHIERLGFGDSSDSPLFTDYQGFRYKIYSEGGILTKTSKSGGNVEVDGDDKRSAHFAVTFGGTAVVGSMRLIQKSNETDPLPVEGFFSSYFNKHPVVPTSVEVSRFALGTEVPSNLRRRVIMALIGTAFRYFKDNNCVGAFATVERPFMGLLTRAEVPFRVLGPPAIVPKYGYTTNFPIAFNTSQMGGYGTEALAEMIKPSVVSNELRG